MMQDNEHEWSGHFSNENTDEEPQVPATLLPNVLRRLGLTQEADDVELSTDDLFAQLQSDNWEARVKAVRVLGKSKIAVSTDIFAPLLHDEDTTVRATTVHVLGNMWQRVPLSWLLEALHDSDWHVREVAVLALGKQGGRVPDEALMMALHDRDSSVREAARFVLQWNSLNERKSVFYGKLWEEERPMQRELSDTSRSNGKHRQTSAETTPAEDWNGAFFEYSARPAPTVREQAHAYAAQEYAPQDATEREAPAYNEGVMHSGKITSHHVRSNRFPKKWLATVIITAALFFTLGRFTASVGPQTSIGILQGTSSSVPDKLFPFDTTPYAPIFQKDLANGLHLTPAQMKEKMNQRVGSLDAVAADQGVSSTGLENIKVNAFQDVFNMAVEEHDIDQGTANKLMQQIKSDSNFQSKATLALLDSLYA